MEEKKNEEKKMRGYAREQTELTWHRGEEAQTQVRDGVVYAPI